MKTQPPTHADPLLRVHELVVTYPGPGGVPKRVVNRVSFSLYRGQTLVLVGGSGCGKSVTALSILGLVQSPGRIVSGSIRLDGMDLAPPASPRWDTVRGSRVGMIFQDPRAAQDPVSTVGSQLRETIRRHHRLPSGETIARARHLLEEAVLADVTALMKLYPHQISGGMCQRVMIALALAGEPEILIADEPTTAIDVVTQARLLRRLADAQQNRAMGMLLITHDLGLVAEMADVVCVMCDGRVVEYGDVFSIMGQPRHPCTKELVNAVIRLGTREAYVPRSPRAAPNPGGCLVQVAPTRWVLGQESEGKGTIGEVPCLAFTRKDQRVSSLP